MTCLTPTPNLALPNCLAVDSCIVGNPSSDKSSNKGANFDSENKFTRPLSRTGSRATSVKGEPGSALESNTSASVKDKNMSSPSKADSYQKKKGLTVRMF